MPLSVIHVQQFKQLCHIWFLSCSEREITFLSLYFLRFARSDPYSAPVFYSRPFVCLHLVVIKQIGHSVVSDAELIRRNAGAADSSIPLQQEGRGTEVSHSSHPVRRSVHYIFNSVNGNIFYYIYYIYFITYIMFVAQNSEKKCLKARNMLERMKKIAEIE